MSGKQGRALMAMVLTAALSACGGGGGSSAAPAATDFHIEFVSNPLTFEFLEGDTSSTRIVTAIAKGTLPGDLYVGVEATGSGLAASMPVTVDEAAGKAYVFVSPGTGLATGLYSGTLTLKACPDAACTSYYKGTPYTLPYTVNVKPRLTVTPATISMTTVESTSPAAQTVQVGGVPFTATVSYAPGASNWLQLQSSSGSLQLTPQTSSLLAGDYQAQVTVRSSDNLQRKDVAVSLRVSKGLLVPASLALAVDSSTSASALSGQITVDKAAAVVAGSWTASSSKSWFVLDTTSAAFGQPLSWHVDAAAFSALPNGATHSASVTVSAGAGVSPVTIAVTASKNLAEIRQVDTLALLAGESGEVLLYGSGFTTNAALSAQLSVSGGLQPANVTVLSDHLASMMLSAVPAGEYTVTLSPASGLSTHSSRLRVLAPQSYSYQKIATTGRKGPLVWDAVSRSAFAVDFGGSRVQRYSGLDAVGLSVSNYSVASPYLLGMDRSLRSLMVVTQSGAVQHLDPATLALQSTDTLGTTVANVSGMLSLIVSGDNRAWLPIGRNDTYTNNAVYTLDLDSGTQVQVDSAGVTYAFYGGPWGLTSANGRRMMVSQSSLHVTQPPMLAVDAQDWAIRQSTSSGATYFSKLAVNRGGSQWLLDHLDMRDFGFGNLGHISLPVGWNAAASALSRDGSRAYVYAVSATAISSTATESATAELPRVYVFDTSALPPAAANYTQLGYFELQDYAGCRAGSGCQSVPEMAITADDGALLLVADRFFIVAPVPGNYQPASTTSFSSQHVVSTKMTRAVPAVPGMQRWLVRGR